MRGTASASLWGGRNRLVPPSGFYFVVLLAAEILPLWNRRTAGEPGQNRSSPWNSPFSDCNDASRGSGRVGDSSEPRTKQAEGLLHVQSGEQQGEAGVPGETPGFGKSGTEQLHRMQPVSNSPLAETTTGAPQPAGTSHHVEPPAYVATGLQSPGRVFN